MFLQNSSVILFYFQGFTICLLCMYFVFMERAQLQFPAVFSYILLWSVDEACSVIMDTAKVKLKVWSHDPEYMHQDDD